MRSIALLLMLVPFPFGSARPVWQWFWAVSVALIALTTHRALKRSANKESGAIPRLVLFGPIILILFGLLQIGPIQSTPISIHPEASLAVSTFFLSHLLWFWIIFHTAYKSSAFHKLIATISLTSTGYALYGLIIYFSGNDSVLWFQKEAYANDLTSTFINRNAFAAYCGIGLQCTVFLLLSPSCSARGRKHAEASSFVIQPLWPIIAIQLLTSALFLTSSRAGISTAMTGASLFLGLAWKNDLFFTSRLRFTQKAIAISISSLWVVMYFVHGDAVQQRLQLVSIDDPRFDAYPLILETIMERPITGFGLGTFEEVFASLRTIDIRIIFDRAHNDLIELTLTAGIVVATMFFCSLFFLLFYLVKSLVPRDASSLITVLAISCFIQILLHSNIDFPMQIPAISYTLVAILAAGLSSAQMRIGAIRGNSQNPKALGPDNSQ